MSLNKTQILADDVFHFVDQLQSAVVAARKGGLTVMCGADHITRSFLQGIMVQNPMRASYRKRGPYMKRPQEHVRYESIEKHIRKGKK